LAIGNGNSALNLPEKKSQNAQLTYNGLPAEDVGVEADPVLGDEHSTVDEDLLLHRTRVIWQQQWIVDKVVIDRISTVICYGIINGIRSSNDTRGHIHAHV